MNESDFLNIENWYGSYYQLAIEFNPTGDDERVLKAISALWSLPELTGPWGEREHLGREPATNFHSQPAFPHHQYGVVTFNQSLAAGCLSIIVRESELKNGSDWLYLSIPTGMLELIFDVQYPLFRSKNSWISIVDQFLLKCAVAVHRESPYEFASIDEEVSGYPNAELITPDEVIRTGGYILSNKLANNLNIELKSELLSPKLLWFPFTD